MKEILRSQPAVGSVTPQLEGASQSVSHPERVPVQPNDMPKKGGAKHE